MMYLRMFSSMSYVVADDHTSRMMHRYKYRRGGRWKRGAWHVEERGVFLGFPRT